MEPGPSRKNNASTSADSLVPIFDPKNLIINYIPEKFSTRQFFNLFAPFGNIEKYQIVPSEIPGHNRGFGFVKFAKSEDAANALDTLQGLRIENKKIKISYARLNQKNIQSE